MLASSLAHWFWASTREKVLYYLLASWSFLVNMVPLKIMNKVTAQLTRERY